MRQQINLYQDVLIDKPEPFQSRQVYMLLVTVVICLIIAGIYSYWLTNSLKTEVVGLRQQQQLLSGQVMALEKQYPKREPSVLLQEEIKRIEQELLGQGKALDYFSQQDQGNNEMILASLEGLARNSQQGIWLRKIKLSQCGQEIQLTGRALKAELVPEYLTLLGEKNIFGGQIFARLKLNRLKEQAGQVNFELDSELKATR